MAVQFVATLLLVTVVSAFPVRDAQKQPNIVFVLGDDCGYGDLGTYPNPKQTHAQLLTPRLDALAQEGLRFTDAYAGAPVCAPSRCTFVTGRHSGHASVRSNGPVLTEDDVGIAEVMRKAGYLTWHVGKWGLGNPDTNPWATPLAKGFDVYYGQTDQNNCHNYYPSLMYEGNNATTVQENVGAGPIKCGTDHEKCAWSGDLWTNRTRQLLHDYATSDSSQPFMLYLSHTTPHAGAVGSNLEDDVPIPRASKGPYAPKRGMWPKVEVDYASAITELDRQVGIVVDALEAEGLSNNTVVLFACDNGPHSEGGHDYKFFDSNGPLQGFKRSLHEGGHRTPLIVRWPGHIPAGESTDYQAAFYDFVPTFADLAGLDPSQLPAHIDGHSFLPTLLGQSQAQPPFVYHEYCAPNENTAGWGQAVRMGEWAALCIGNQPQSDEDFPVCKTPQLFNLTADPGQETDVAPEHPDVVQQVMAIMKAEHTPGHYCGHA